MARFKLIGRRKALLTLSLRNVSVGHASPELMFSLAFQRKNS